MAVKIVWKRGAFRELRTQPAVVADIEARAKRIAAACGDGFEVRSEVTGGRGRARSVVLATTPRAMVRNADKLANRETVPVANTRFLNIPPDSPLYTSVGRVIERLGLTELPQLVHVLRGEMSLVGNRPLPENVMDCLRLESPYADDRFLSPAGLTGPAQLVGRDSLTDAERLTLEGAYCRTAAHSYTFWLDFKIILYTVLIVLHLKESLTYQEVLDLVQGGPVVPVQMPHPHVTQLATADSDVAEAAVS